MRPGRSSTVWLIYILRPIQIVFSCTAASTPPTAAQAITRNGLSASWCAAMRKEPAASASSPTRDGATTEVQHTLYHAIRGFIPTIPRLDLFWKKCAELKIPVNTHIADHPSCWQPLGPNQERTPDFQHFNLYGKDVPSYEELLGHRDRLLERHPDTRFIACHLSNQGNNLAAAGQALDRFPNLYFDISARDYELGRQPRDGASVPDALQRPDSFRHRYGP